MIALTIGILTGIAAIIAIKLLSKIENRLLCSLVLTGIGFLYIGFTWSHLPSLLLNALQAVFFLLLAYIGMTKNISFLIAGFFLHGAWDLLYSFFPHSELIPPHYDLFCMAADFTIGFYLLFGIKKRKQLSNQPSKEKLKQTAPAFDFFSAERSFLMH